MGREILIPFAQVQTHSVPLAASTTTLGTPFGVSYPYDQLVVLATLTGMSAGTLDMYIQESWDQGTTWSDVAHFAQVGIAGAASTQRFSLSNAGTIAVVGTAGTPALAVATRCDGPWAPLLRLVSVTGVNTNAAPVLQTVKFIAWQQSHV